MRVFARLTVHKLVSTPVISACEYCKASKRSVLNPTCLSRPHSLVFSCNWHQHATSPPWTQRCSGWPRWRSTLMSRYGIGSFRRRISHTVSTHRSAAAMLARCAGCSACHTLPCLTRHDESNRPGMLTVTDLQPVCRTLTILVGLHQHLLKVHLYAGSCSACLTTTTMSTVRK